MIGAPGFYNLSGARLDICACLNVDPDTSHDVLLKEIMKIIS
jgi:hypothetical protein